MSSIIIGPQSLLIPAEPGMIIDLVNKGVMSKATALESVGITFTENTGQTYKFMQDWYEEASSQKNYFTQEQFDNITDAKKLFFAMEGGFWIDGNWIDDVVDYFKRNDPVFFEKYSGILSRPKILDIKMNTTTVSAGRRALNYSYTQEMEMDILCSGIGQAEENLVSIMEAELLGTKR